MTPDLTPILPFLPDLVKGRPLAVLTGAGVSVESGLPTFRGPGGLWEGVKPEELATEAAFLKDPAKVWRWYAWRLSLVRKARPNPGHIALARMERLLPRMTLVTQNVDGLHRAAGSRALLELHGSILRTRCTAEGTEQPAPESLDALPHCPSCDALLRPAVVWFGESLPEETWRAAERAASDCAVFLVVGTSSVVAPASSLAVTAVRAGATLFEVNPENTPMAPLAEGVFRASAAEVLPLLANAMAAG